MAVSKRLRFEIFRRDGFRCRYCGATPEQAELRVDHVIPEALGGKTEPANLATACHDCNSGKTSVAPDSATVADVDERAQRWAQALADAARQIEDDRQAVAERHDWFRTQWNTWTYGGGKHFELPRDWLATIDALTKAGLTRELLTGAIETAMNGTHVRDRFRYFCGVSWRIAEQISERAEAAMAAPDSSWPGPPVAPYTELERFASDLIHVVIENFDEDLVEAAYGDVIDEGIPRERRLVTVAYRLVNAMAAALAVAEKANV